MQQSLVHPSSVAEATASATPACQPTNPAQAEICSRGTLDALRAELQRHPPEVQDAALAATGLRLDDRATAADFGELLVAAQAQVQVQAATQDEAAASTARYAAVVTEVLLTMDADIALLLQQADASRARPLASSLP